jgi:hypothetical protein
VRSRAWIWLVFIDRQHQGLVGRIDVEADDILDLGDEVRMAREFQRGGSSGVGTPWEPDSLTLPPFATHLLK